jgi:hypothetical protein
MTVVLSSHPTAHPKSRHHVAAVQPSQALKAAVPLAFQVVSPSSQRWPVVDLEREKLLLTETHHRIKNHLQIISSLLNMQINGVSDQDARNALRSSQNRVRAIAALHQHLYQVALGKGDTFSDFTRDLVAHLRECYELHADQIAVRLGNPGRAPCSRNGSCRSPSRSMRRSPTASSMPIRMVVRGRSPPRLSYTQASGELVIRTTAFGLPRFSSRRRQRPRSQNPGCFADQMRGQLFVQGNPDQGTEIKLRFPLASRLKDKSFA